LITSNQIYHSLGKCQEASPWMLAQTSGWAAGDHTMAIYVPPLSVVWLKISPSAGLILNYLKFN